jgi:hypothetical protein
MSARAAVKGEEVDAGFDRRIDDGRGLFKVEPSSEIVAPKAQRGKEAGAAERAFVHGLLRNEVALEVRSAAFGPDPDRLNRREVARRRVQYRKS